MDNNGLVVLGGGIAGLVAARELAQHGFSVTLIEARERLGGRIFTKSLETAVPVELGAEFIHGAKAVTWNLVRESGLETHEVPDRHWKAGRDGCLVEEPRFWDRLEHVMGALEGLTTDSDFLSAICTLNITDDGRRLALSYVEGFHAARPDRISIKSLLRSDESAEEDEGQKQFRVVKGYGALVDWLAADARKAGVKILTGRKVRCVKWGAAGVDVCTSGDTFQARYCLCTLPVGVLADQQEIEFVPEIPEKRCGAGSILAGNVAKAVLEFKERFWPVENFGFVHEPAREFPTCWTDERAPILTAWAGGPKAEALLSLGSDEVVRRAVASIGSFFGKGTEETMTLLKSAHHHDWSADPYSRAAYSYIPAGAINAPLQLAEPVKNTLFFAGEATMGDGRNGTVHGAIESALRAVKEVKRAACRA